MAYDKFSEFFMDFNKAYPNAGYEQSVRAFTYYCHGLKQGGAGGLTIGLIQHLQEKLKHLKSVMGKSKTDPAWHNSDGKIFVDESAKQNKWKIWHNDSFILGGIHSHGPFELVAPNCFEAWFEEKFGDIATLGFAGARQLDFVTSEDADEAYPLRVTQREVIGLNEFGYVGSGEGLTTFVCRQEPNADSANLVDYRKAVGSVTSALGFTAEQ